MTRLESLGNPKVRDMNARRNWAGDNQFGVTSADIRTLAKEIKANPELAAELWKTGNADAMLLATLLMRPKQLSADEVDALVRSAMYSNVADWLITNVVKVHPEKESLRQKWMQDEDPFAARAGWSLTVERIKKNPEGVDLKGLLDRIEKELAAAPPMAQWTMNFCLAETGINFPEHRQRALDIGERLGVYRDFPCSKGCTSPFAPIWINGMVSRQA